jgi:TRAP-type C4-dicarboxylate transport system permease small subunit
MIALDALLRRAVGVGNAVSMAALVIMALLTVVDVGGRYLLNRPLLGALELSEVMLVLMVFGCFAYTEQQNGHVDIDVVVTRFSPRAQALTESFAALLSTAFWGMIAWRTGVRAIDMQQAGETTANLGLLVAPFIWIAAAGSALFTLTLVARVLRTLGRVART